MTAKRKPAKPRNNKHRQELLDEALDETFPASDPPAMLEPAPPAPANGQPDTDPRRRSQK